MSAVVGPLTDQLTWILRGSPYQSYLYAYPHKTAYRTFQPRVSLVDAWKDEDRSRLALYLHLPFCEMRCGFCNLFTTSQPAEDLVTRYLSALEEEARVVADIVGPATFTSLAIGGGTPTHLDVPDLHRVLDVFDRLGARPGTRLASGESVTLSVETSPRTATPERIELLTARGTTRFSIGVQSFLESETRGAARPQRRFEVESALDVLRKSPVSVLNIDLIYGLPGQTTASFLESIRIALRWRPEELYLYPLYVRPLTGLGLSPKAWDDVRLGSYRAGRDFLTSEGCEQVSMRMFRRAGTGTPTGPVTCCQTDGMVGLGCGARSYTRRLHSADAFAVSAAPVRHIIDTYVKRPASERAFATHGIRLSADEERRRFVIQSLLQTEGLALDAYSERFASDAIEDLPILGELVDHQFAVRKGFRLALTPSGLERSDAIGPALVSPEFGRLMAEYVLA